MTTIYCLCDDETIYYVGQTVDMKKRYIQHQNKHDRGVGADLIPAGAIWRMEHLETVDTTDAVMAERFYCEYLEPTLNKQLPGRSKAEYTKLWQQSNPDKFKASKQRWLEKNRDKQREYQRLGRLRKKANQTLA
jgi:predicted GIY-YIG superfamily endonuclease